MALTKNDLVALNSKLAAENTNLRAELSREKFAREAIEAELARLRKREIELELQVGAVTSVASAVNQLNGPAARKQALDAARELAMRSGRCIRVV